ncbi:putative membrane protein [Gracilibacillus halotolerans]|uniref:Putative membrane protein n=1 Tax=Gracilibacillus halotolerans TaxID=74386 RepID=A0A841RJL3_9BACI|nr:NEW3 domain-containing protein [Gracilibacillus halotolerans]MBB6512057.1 putative membrane protein [Gracilibacillus halotolerans]
MFNKQKKILSYFLIFLLSFSLIKPTSLEAVEGVSLFTPYTGLSATPGETINYSVDVINDSSSIQNMSFSLEDFPKEWEYSLTAGGREIKELSVRANSEEVITLDITTPLEVKKADYRFSLVASDGNNKTRLPFVVTISEQGTLATELTSDQTNLQGHADSDFSYSITLRNRTAEEQNYALSSKAESGWGVAFKSGSDSISSISVEPNGTANINVKVTPPESIAEGTYKIPIRAESGNMTADLELEATITGSYDMELTTPEGNLSTNITAGQDKTVELVIKNTGTATLTDIELSATTPPDWETEFDKETIPEIEPGKSETVKATIEASSDAIAGDYVASFTAKSAEKSAEATYRIAVKTSTLWGIVAVLIIVGVVAGLYYIVRKYGRR